ncbi:PhaM family polyhydroxyalkanoate granule multifunctional regulatory protein [Ideonella sp.]|jgi:hypothetical protein|uniref:PhaM family polyhydroxyalkanoate granule multifunctional regulatory protein n=1 Tax=Ideonella sp. TaxID=1929293 RepID=UPI0037BE6831
MADSNPFSKMVPGFDFLQGLVKNAGQALPSIGQWVAPTLDPVELEKEIEKLRTVQFWLEQNARMVATTIQAMEVQRMTLSTLKTMNVSVTELRDAMTLKPAAKAEEAAPAAKKASSKADADADAQAPAGVVDPMQWWGALTKQFTQIAATAMKESAADAARNAAGTMVKQSMDAAADTLKKAASMPAAVAQQAVDMAAAATKTVASASRAATASAKAPAAAKKATTTRKTTTRKPATKKTTR